MNAKIIIAAMCLVSFNLCAAAVDGETSLAGVAVSSGESVVIDCQHEMMPSRDAIGQVLQTNNANSLAAGRELVAHFAHRECMRGAGSVVFVRDLSSAPTTPSLALSETRTQR